MACHGRQRHHVHVEHCGHGHADIYNAAYVDCGHGHNSMLDKTSWTCGHAMPLCPCPQCHAGHVDMMAQGINTPGTHASCVL